MLAPRGVTVFQAEVDNVSGNASLTQLKAMVDKVRRVGNS